MNIDSKELIELVEDLYTEYIEEDGLEPLAAVEAIITDIASVLVRNRLNQAIVFSILMLKIKKANYNGDDIKKARHFERLNKEFKVIYNDLAHDERNKHKLLVNSYLGNSTQVEVSEILKYGY